MSDLASRLGSAVAHFWRTRARSAKKQAAAESPDKGNRGAVTAGKHFDGFNALIADLLVEAGVPRAAIHRRARIDAILPGFFRATKEWDLLAVVGGTLVAAIEFKALGGPSFGNNYNNRAEEAVGNAHDLWTAYREGRFGARHRPWLGYVYLVEDAPGSRRPVKVKEPHFKIDPAFNGKSYAERCQLTCERLILERLYNSACLIPDLLTCR